MWSQVTSTLESGEGVAVTLVGVKQMSLGGTVVSTWMMG
jgi:hypothetical protein